MNDVNSLSVKILRKIEDLNTIRKNLLNFLLSNNVNVDDISTIELSVYEILINIIEHESDEFKDKEIDFNCIINSDEVKIIITYHGVEFNINEAPLPDLAEHKKSGKNHGLGIYMIRTLMDKINYSFKDDISRLEIIKNR